MDSHAGTFNPEDFSWRGLAMTPAAAAHIRELVSKQPDKQGLRLGVKTSGCAGFGYVSNSSLNRRRTICFLSAMARNCGRRCRPCRLSMAPSSTTSAKV